MTTIKAKRENLFMRIARFYIDGFRNMKLGKTLWAIILIKLFIMFAILKVFFFPNFLKQQHCQIRICAAGTYQTWNKPLKH